VIGRPVGQARCAGCVREQQSTRAQSVSVATAKTSARLDRSGLEWTGLYARRRLIIPRSAVRLRAPLLGISRACCGSLNRVKLRLVESTEAVLVDDDVARLRIQFVDDFSIPSTSHQDAVFGSVRAPNGLAHTKRRVHTAAVGRTSHTGVREVAENAVVRRRNHQFTVPRTAQARAVRTIVPSNPRGNVSSSLRARIARRSASSDATYDGAGPAPPRRGRQ